MLAAALSLGLGWMLLRPEAPAAAQLEPTLGYAAEEVQCPDETADLTLSRFPIQVELQPGQTLDTLLAELGLDASRRYTAVEALGDHLEVRRLRPGLEVTGFVDAAGDTHELEVVLRGEGRVRLAPRSAGWSTEWKPFSRAAETRRAEGLIGGSLVVALDEAGAPMDLAYRMADVLRWDVDFNRDLRTGDRFQVIFEEIYLDGRRYRTGEVIGLVFWNRGRQLEAFRFEEGYYDAEGRPLRKMFLRSPLPFSRVTSRFSTRRFHPVLKTYRPHYGVDYGAPTGTPVRATANGVVSFAAWDKGGGRMVKIRHPNDYLTAYLHLSGFAKGISSGRRVRQGDVIGYVGSTGLATGPHLDYRVQHRGRWIDPLSIKAVPADPIAQQTLPEFIAFRDRVRRGLEVGLEAMPAPEASTRVATLAERQPAPPPTAGR